MVISIRKIGIDIEEWKNIKTNTEENQSARRGGIIVGLFGISMNTIASINTLPTIVQDGLAHLSAEYRKIDHSNFNW